MCEHVNKVYVFSDKKIKRYMEKCADCGKFIRWIPNVEWEKIKDRVKIIQEATMGGCFGDTPIDRYLEKQVDEYCGQPDEAEMEEAAEDFMEEWEEGDT